MRRAWALSVALHVLIVGALWAGQRRPEATPAPLGGVARAEIRAPVESETEEAALGEAAEMPDPGEPCRHGPVAEAEEEEEADALHLDEPTAVVVLELPRSHLPEPAEVLRAARARGPRRVAPGPGPASASAVVPAPAAAPAPTPRSPPSGVAPATARLLYAPDPRAYYPRAALERGLEGDALVEAALGEAGGVKATRVLRSSGEALLDAAAQRYARALRFDAGPAGRLVRVPVHFRFDARLLRFPGRSNS